LISNTNDNKVISGIRFEKHNKIFYPIIQESMLLPNGDLNKSTSDWLPRAKEEDGIIFEIDYETMFELNEIIATTTGAHELPNALTGFKLKTESNKITFEAQFSKFNLTTGIIVKGKDEWKLTNCLNCETFNQKHKDIPTDYSHHILETAPPRYYTFRQVGTKKYMGQWTVPFFDMQPVESKYVVSGVGIGIRKTLKNESGGFIQFILTSLNFADYMETSDDI